MNDPIADFLIRIKNAALSSRKTVVAPHSKFKEELAKIMQKEGYLEKVEISSDKAKKEIVLTLVNEGVKVRKIEVKRISKLGRRVYSRAKDLPKLNRGLGIIIISTPSGLMTIRQAMKEKLGGEVICKLI